MRLTQRYKEGLAFVFDLHQNQERKGSGIPYLSHLLSVSSLVMEHGGEEDLAIAGLLHDAAEDQGGETTLLLIEEKFGTRVAKVVRACTDALEEPKLPWRERKRKYLDKLASASTDVALVATCDKLHNLRCISSDYRTEGERLWSRFSGGKEGVLWYYQELMKALPGPESALVTFRDEMAGLLRQIESNVLGTADS